MKKTNFYFLTMVCILASFAFACNSETEKKMIEEPVSQALTMQKASGTNWTDTPNEQLKINEHFTLLNNKWGKDDAYPSYYQKVEKSGSFPDKIWWYWNNCVPKPGLEYSVKGYPSINLRFSNTSDFIPLVTMGDIDLKWFFDVRNYTGTEGSYPTGILNCAWDIWITNDLGTDTIYELMIWPYQHNQDSHYGYFIADTSIDGGDWELRGADIDRGDGWKYYAFRRKVACKNNYLHLNKFIESLETYAYSFDAGKKVIKSIEAGSEIKEGSGSVFTYTYRIIVNGKEVFLN